MYKGRNFCILLNVKNYYNILSNWKKFSLTKLDGVLPLVIDISSTQDEV